MTDWLGGDQHGMRVIVPHVNNDWYHWLSSDTTDGVMEVVYRDAIGRRNNGDGWRWAVMRCVQAACPGEVIVRLWAIEATVNQAVNKSVDEGVR